MHFHEHIFLFSYQPSLVSSSFPNSHSQVFELAGEEQCQHFSPIVDLEQNMNALVSPLPYVSILVLLLGMILLQPLFLIGDQKDSQKGLIICMILFVGVFT